MVTYLKNGEATLFAQAPTNLSQNTGSYGGTMTARILSGEDYQHWNVSYCGNGYYTITSLANDRFAVTVPSGYEASSSISLALIPFSPSNDHQKWRFIPTNNGRYKITAMCTNNDSLVFDLQSNSSSPGTAIIQGAWESNNNYDEWYLVPYETALLMGFDDLYDSNDGYWYGTRNQLQKPNNETIIAVKTAHFDCSSSEMIAYMQSCDILFVMTHGLEQSIQISKTGLSLWLTTYDLNNVDLSNLKLAVFLACYAGDPYCSPINFIQKVNNCGAEAVVGFSDQVQTGDLDEFAEVFSKLLMKGFTSGEAIDRIKNPYSYYNPDDPDSIPWIPPMGGLGFLAKIEFVGNSYLTLPHN